MHPTRGVAALCILICASAGAAAQQAPDTTYRPQVAAPEFKGGEGPSVLIDAAHLNFHTADAGFLPFANLLRVAGYRVGANQELFSAASLQSVDILVIANAMHSQSRDAWAPLPNLAAFSDEEIAAVETWVREGGSLLLIADHMPLAGHAESLAAAFGVRFQNGFAFRRGTRQGRITFRRSDGSLRPGVLTDGRGTVERTDSVTAFTGQAFRVDRDVDGSAFLVLSDEHELLLPTVAWEFSDSTARIPAAGLLQGAALRHGRGRVAVFGEAAMFTAQVAGPDRVPVGMNAPIAAQNSQFVLNVMRWLSGRVP